MYESGTDPYIYAGTQILKNLLGIVDRRKLAKVERQFTALRARQGLPPGKLDYAHYRSIHRHLFQDIYAWAGEPRTLNISKGGSPFCRVEFIDSEMTKLLNALRGEKHLQGLDYPATAKRAAHYLVELNAIHPFREGNGRTQHAFLGLLLEHAGHPRDISRIDPKKLLQVAIDGFDGDEALMVEVISNLPPREAST
jgi:cell filamentation protein